MTNVNLGSISHGTMRPCDLIPIFMEKLRELDPNAAARIIDEYGATFIERCSNPNSLAHPIHEVGNEGWLLETLFDALDACAPDGYYFGASSDNGSDYGFWWVDEYSPNDEEWDV